MICPRCSGPMIPLFSHFACKNECDLRPRAPAPPPLPSHLRLLAPGVVALVADGPPPENWTHAFLTEDSEWADVPRMLIRIGSPPRGTSRSDWVNNTGLVRHLGFYRSRNPKMWPRNSRGHVKPEERDMVLNGKVFMWYHGNTTPLESPIYWIPT